MPVNQKIWCVYILSSLTGTLYVGMTDDLRHRMIQHKRGLYDGFTKKHQINRLMYYEVVRDAIAAANREKQIKKYRRGKKVALFKDSNPGWADLTTDIWLSELRLESAWCPQGSLSRPIGRARDKL